MSFPAETIPERIMREYANPEEPATRARILKLALLMVRGLLSDPARTEGMDLIWSEDASKRTVDVDIGHIPEKRGQADVRPSVYVSFGDFSYVYGTVGGVGVELADGSGYVMTRQVNTSVTITIDTTDSTLTYNLSEMIDGMMFASGDWVMRQFGTQIKQFRPTSCSNVKLQTNAPNAQYRVVLSCEVVYDECFTRRMESMTLKNIVTNDEPVL